VESKRGDQLTPVEKGLVSRTPPPAATQNQTESGAENTSSNPSPTANDKAE